MDTLKKLFPLSFKYTRSVADFIVGILIYLIIGVIAGAVIWLAGLLTGWIPVVGIIVCWALRIIAAIVDIWVVAGIIIQILVFLKVIK